MLMRPQQRNNVGLLSVKSNIKKDKPHTTGIVKALHDQTDEPTLESTLSNLNTQVNQELKQASYWQRKAKRQRRLNNNNNYMSNIKSNSSENIKKIFDEVIESPKPTKEEKEEKEKEEKDVEDDFWKEETQEMTKNEAMKNQPQPESEIAKWRNDLERLNKKMEETANEENDMSWVENMNVIENKFETLLLNLKSEFQTEEKENSFNLSPKTPRTIDKKRGDDYSVLSSKFEDELNEVSKLKIKLIEDKKLTAKFEEIRNIVNSKSSLFSNNFGTFLNNDDFDFNTHKERMKTVFVNSKDLSVDLDRNFYSFSESDSTNVVNDEHDIVLPELQLAKQQIKAQLNKYKETNNYNESESEEDFHSISFSDSEDREDFVQLDNDHFRDNLSNMSTQKQENNKNPIENKYYGDDKEVVNLGDKLRSNYILGLSDSDTSDVEFLDDSDYDF